MTDVAGEPAGAGQEAPDAVAVQAAQLATEVTEAREEQERRRLTAAFAAAVRSGARATGRGARAGARATGRGARSGVRATGRGARSGARATGRGVRAARRGAGAGTGWLAGQVVAMAPRIRVRNQAALRVQFPGQSTEDIADALITGAARASAAVGGAVGSWAALPVLPAWPAEIVAETLALVGIEIKLIAELHEAYGTPASGNAIDRATAYVGAWAHRRGVLAATPGGLILVAGSPLARRLRWRLARRVGRSTFSLGPLFTGAMAGAVLNSVETRRLGQDVRADLRRRAPRDGPATLSAPAPADGPATLDAPAPGDGSAPLGGAAPGRELPR
jgi:hypothetical protein